MLYSHYTEDFLGIEEGIISKVERDKNAGIIHIYMSLEQQYQECPHCKEAVYQIHDYKERQVKCPPYGNNNLLIHYRKRRYRCNSCQKRFAERNTLVRPYQRMSDELMAYILERLKSNHTVKSIAREANVSPATVNRLFSYIADPPKRLPRVLSIDEFKGNAGGEKFQAILTDPIHHRVFDILPGRQNHHLTSYFHQFPREERQKVEAVVMDMTKYYRETAQVFFPNAKIIADPFHFVRQVNWALEDIRKETQANLTQDRRRYFKRSRFLLLKRMSKLKKEEREYLFGMLEFSARLAEAYWLKEKFMTFMDATDEKTIRNSFSLWLAAVDQCSIERFKKVAETFRQWATPIINARLYRYSNGFTEGINNKIKVLKRNAFGLRNFERFRLRIIYSCS